MTGSSPFSTSHRPRTDADKGQSQTLFLALFLLLLAFFILLNTLSTIEEGRSTEVLKSVQDAFPSEIQAQLKDSFLDGDPGSVIGEGVRSRIGAVFQASLPVIEITADPSGSPLYVSVPSRSVFSPALGGVTREAETLARQLVPLLEGRPGEPYMDLQILFGRGDDDAREQASAADQALIIGAASTALRFGALGVPRARVTGGIEPGDGDITRFVFRIHPARGG